MSTTATLSAVPFATSICTGEEIPVKIILSVKGEAVNAAQGTLRFDPALMRVASVTTGRSVFRFWAIDPVIDQRAGTVTFAGGLPTPGYVGEGGTLLTLNIVPLQQSGEVVLAWDTSTRVLLNDGKGTPAQLSLKGTRLQVFAQTSNTCVAPRTTPVPVVDTISPEPFEVIIATTPEGFQGDYFASFYAYDADSGIARYEVRENGESWHAERSPYRLRQQQGQMLIEVKAVDASGNERISSASAMLEGSASIGWGPWWFWLIAAIAVASAIWRSVIKHRQTKRLVCTRPETSGRVIEEEGAKTLPPRKT